jgi:ribosomal protein L11 methyltransferase
MATAPARTPSLIRLAVRCRPQAAERVLAELLALAPNGVEEEHGSEWVEYAIYGARGELPDLGSIEALTEGERIEVSSESIPDDWADRWRDFHEPVWIANGRVVVRPSWASPQPRPAQDPGKADAGAHQKDPSRRRGKGIPAGAEHLPGIDVVVDPGQAFGTGAHPTTRMCVELLVDMADSGEVSGGLADLGTGSGVLAITAAKLGFSPVIAVDHELPALEAVAANSRANGTTVDAMRVNLREEPPPATRTAVANLTAPLLHTLAGHWERQGPPRHVVCSGMLVREADEVAGAISRAGLRQRSRLESGDWAALALEGR